MSSQSVAGVGAAAVAGLSPELVAGWSKVQSLMHEGLRGFRGEGSSSGQPNSPSECAPDPHGNSSGQQQQIAHEVDGVVEVAELDLIKGLP